MNLISFITTILLTFLTTIAFAFDFYGASVGDKDVPTVAWKAGIYGVHPIINEVIYGSPAEKAGFIRGDIILSINNNDVKRSSDLHKTTHNSLNVYILSGVTRKALVIDRQAIETERIARIARDKKTAYVAPHRPTGIVASTDNSTPLKFDNAYLQRKYGKTEPTYSDNNKLRGSARFSSSSNTNTPQATYQSAPSYRSSGYLPRTIEPSGQSWNGTVMPGSRGGMVVGGPLNGTVMPGSEGGMIVGGPLNGTVMPGSDGGMIVGGPLNGTVMPGSGGGMIIGGPMNGTYMPPE